MKNRERLELHRQSDGLIHYFNRQKRDDGTYGYRRRDLDVWMIKSPKHGWVVVSPDNEISGKPWSTPSDEPSEFPPEGDWVSKKGSKSYVYSLIYPDTET